MGCSQEDWNTAHKTRLAPMGEAGRNRKIAEEDVMDTSETLPGEWSRAVADAVETSEERLGKQVKRSRLGDLHVASVADKEVMKGHAPWWTLDSQARWDATHSTAGEGVNDAIYAWIAEERNRVFGQGLPREKEKLHGALATAVGESALSSWT